MIKINSNKGRHHVPLATLNVGDTFLFEGKVCMLAINRGGTSFVLDLSTGKDCLFPINPANDPQPVIPIDCELSYQIRQKGA